MKKIVLGNTGLEVTELCFGALPMGPLQKNLPVDVSASIIAHGLKSGINFIDTALMYKTYEPIKKAIEMTGIRPIISNKSHLTTYEEMEQSINTALTDLGVDYLDIMLLHAARVSTNILSEREGAYRCLLDYREKGILKSIGISTHAVDVVELSANTKELDIVFPILNHKGLGILRGSITDMENAINMCFEKDKGLYLMKALGGGNLVEEYLPAMEYARGFLNGKAPIVIGMTNNSEVDMNVKYFNNEDITNEINSLSITKKEISVFKAICKNCGVCVNTCHSSAIDIIDEKAHINQDKCLKCGYCVDACKEFAIRVI